MPARWLLLFFLLGCGSSNASAAGDDGSAPPPGDDDSGSNADAGHDATTNDAPSSDASGDAPSIDAACTPAGGDAGLCYSLACGGKARSLQENRDRLLADLAPRRCTDTCSLWAALNEAERYIFLMDTAYLGAPASYLYPKSSGNLETALDHAVALYSINGPDGSTLGGLDYNRIYLGFDALATCVMRNFAIAMNGWEKSDDLAGPHAPFTQREMIAWYRAIYDPQTQGPQWHHWHQDSDFAQDGINQRAGVCNVSDRSLTELTIAFDFTHNSDPLGDYQTRGGYGWQIVDQYAGLDGGAGWSYSPTGCPVTPPVNMNQYGGTYAGRGPSLDGGGCWAPSIDGGGSCP